MNGIVLVFYYCIGKKTAHSGVVKKSRTEHFCSIRLGTGVFEELPYNLNNNVGYVNLGQSRDTAEFASESVAKWWHFIGEESFPGCKKLFIVCDGGGSNGSRVRLWKWALACFAEFYGLEIHVSHLPPGTSKWNKVEHRLFSYISKSWTGQPLVDIETVVNLISNTTTRTGLKVRCDIDNNVYLKGTKITDEELDQIALDPIPEFGTWNYIIRGFKHSED